MKRAAAVIVFLILAAAYHSVLLPPAASAENEYDVYLKGESFTWKEFDNGGDQLLKESGPIYGVGGLAKLDIKSLTLKIRGELFGGRIDYDGQTQEGTPVQTDVDYLGVKIEGNIGYKFNLTERFSVEPFAGPGYRYWERDIKSTSLATGYLEKWSSVYVQAGIHSDIAFYGLGKVFVEGGIKFPVHNENEADLSVLGSGTVTLEPGKKESFFAEAGVKWKMLRTAVFYEGLRFSKSEVVRGGHQLWYQPESKGDIYGVNIGLTF
ncbi:MAG: outer membrane beta-barrel protein [Nitrospirae bacterium]|nr:outer membrane beta-barrel protein [Nitrospirota bacterium]